MYYATDQISRFRVSGHIFRTWKRLERVYYAAFENPRFRAAGPISCAWKKSEECHADYIFTFAHLTYSDIFF